jgi:hypothetical protein
MHQNDVLTVLMVRLSGMASRETSCHRAKQLWSTVCVLVISDPSRLLDSLAGMPLPLRTQLAVIVASSHQLQIWMFGRK